jgi:hypothetical protein
MYKVLLSLLCCGLLAQGANAEETELNWGLKAGTLGFGVDASKAINSGVSLRLNMNKLSYSTEVSSDYSAILEANREYNLQTIGLLVDFHLLQLRVTAGAYINNNEIIETTKPSSLGGISLNSIPYDLSKIAAVKSTVTFNKISPYLGVGWGNNGNRDGWNITLDVGLMYHGDPKLDLEIITNPKVPSIIGHAIQADALLEKEIQERDLSDFPFYPVVMIGINYSF